MALVVKDRVKETTTTTGTGTITLAGAVSGFQSFSVIGNANTTYYAIVGQGTTEWEVGIGTYTSSGTTLSRDTVLESSNSNALVPFSAGTKDVFVTYPADKAVYADGSDNVTLPANLSVNGTTTLGDASGDSVTFNAATVSTPNGLNFDSNTLVIDAANNRVGIGASPGDQKFQVFDATSARAWVIGNAETNFVAARYSTDANAATLAFRKGRGTYASQTTVASGDVIGNILFQGYGGTNVRNLTEIRGFVDTYTSDSNISAYMTFSTSPSGGAAATERMRITAAGGVSFGGTGTAYGTTGQALTSNGNAPPSWGTLGVAGGGTGATTLTANNVILGNGTSAVQFVAPGTTGNVLTSNGTTWTSAAGISLSANNAFTGANTFYNDTGQTFGTATSTNDGIILDGRAGGTGSFRVTLVPTTLTASRTLTLPDATTTVAGTDATQTLTNKTISADSNTLSGIAASSFVLSNASGNIDGAAAQKAIPTGAVVGTTDTQTLTNKTIQGGCITRATAVSASTTAVDFTGIPSWVERVTILFQGVSTTGSSNILVQVGTSSGVVATGYNGTGSNEGGTTASSTAGFPLRGTNGSTNTYSGSVVLHNITGNTWVESGVLRAGNTNLGMSGGDIALAATLDRVRITTVIGTDTFDAGTLNIIYEG
jgi:hypothetical protein